MDQLKWTQGNYVSSVMTNVRFLNSNKGVNWHGSTKVQYTQREGFICSDKDANRRDSTRGIKARESNVLYR